MNNSTYYTRSKCSYRNISTLEKLHAVLRIKSGETKASVSRDIEVPESTLRGWCKSEERLRISVINDYGGNSYKNSFWKYIENNATVTGQQLPTATAVSSSSSLANRQLNSTSGINIGSANGTIVSPGVNPFQNSDSEFSHVALQLTTLLQINFQNFSNMQANGLLSHQHAVDLFECTKNLNFLTVVWLNALQVIQNRGE